MNRDMIDLMLEFRKSGDMTLLITSNFKIEKKILNVIVINILDWLELEHKRSIWISQGRPTCLKPLQINMKYLWCKNLYRLVKEEKLFQEYFSVNEKYLTFSDLVPEDERIRIREKTYQFYKKIYKSRCL